MTILETCTLYSVGFGIPSLSSARPKFCSQSHAAIPAGEPLAKSVPMARKFSEQHSLKKGDMEKEGNSAVFEKKDFAVPRRKAMTLIFSSFVLSNYELPKVAYAQPVEFREYIDTFDGYSFLYPRNWIQVRGAGADIFFRDPLVLDENLSVEISSPSSSKYKSVEDLGPPEEAGKGVLRQYLTEFMSTRLGVRRESSVLSTSSRVADDGKLYYDVEVNIKSYANNNELAVMPQDRVARLEWDRRYLSVLGVENNCLYELRIQTPEKVFAQEESDIRAIMDSFRVNKTAA
ncbi:psbP domain-containing protein 1, chloroplastic isoform X1 [Capsicum chacoense]|uniref:PsbP domain-containing protein 1, chloroplastic n=2 Tax=Capsicum annuum TaxID=4072 RepID=A0A1U8DWE0_CAPAN|nr:psbP domain-containing protein 1, chloroplastic isoform X1 [Capsicum annuum]KAF3621865.1 PsbP domain-containing protein 1, chloroplastic [Capsicum annuum]KAF3650398.1 PsbP domain-containing protein 1, chloroplastic [Capsicum annuum]PHT64270.1 PsbP domain-containing protein 1, chloroplastic [Capsicum annuum]